MVIPNLSGIHDDNFWVELHRERPKDFIPRAYIHAEELTEEEITNAVKMTGSFGLAKRWCKANLKPDFPELHDIV